MILKIRKANDPILRQPTEKVVDFGHEFQFFIDNMIETMRKNNGIGLAAPQLGISKKIFICEFTGDEKDELKGFPLTIICNPEITFSSKEKQNMVEGCLSFPGMELLIKRPKKITIKGQDRYGKNIEIEAKDIYAKVLQHENDHLNCTLFIDHLQEIPTLFIGTGTLGVNTLELLAKDKQYKIVAVITGEDKKISRRNEIEKANPISEVAKKYQLPIIKTNNINQEEIIEKIKALKPKIGIMADFGQIICKEILDIPKFGIINIHPSLLPKHRGPAPIVQTILDGDEVTGISLIIASPKMDAGPILSHITVKLSQSETTSIIKDFLAETAATLVLDSIPYYLAGDLKPEAQDENLATYTKMTKAEDGLIDENTPAIVVDRKIRAFDAWPRAYSLIDGKRIQLLEAHFEENNKFLIDRVKPEGKTEMSYEEYLRGYKKELTYR